MLTLDGLRFRVLGRVTVWRGDREIPLGSGMQRALLARLLLDAGRPVPREQLIEFLWPGEPPASAINLVQTYVKRLRRIVTPGREAGQGVLRSVPGGYVLDGADVDLVRFRELSGGDAEGRNRLMGDGGRVKELHRLTGIGGRGRKELREVIGAWDGPPVADLASEIRAHARVAALEEELLAGAVAYADAALAAGEAADVAKALEPVSGWAPTHEPLHARLIQAYVAAGRQEPAELVYERVRARLDETLGVAPGQELSEALASGTQARAATWTGPPPRQLVGRDDAVAEVIGLVSGGHPVTLTGPAGVGKSSLALAAADRLGPAYPGGVTVAELGQLPAGASTETLGWLVERALDGQREPTVLVLDNAEHVLSSCAALAQRLHAEFPHLRTITTSRRPLGVPGEQMVEVRPLRADRADSDATALFLRRASECVPDLDLSGQKPVIAVICRHLGGLPLAIELAAARLRSMSLSALTRRLGALGETTAYALPHQRSLSESISWSLDLLSPAQRSSMYLLSVFTGEFGGEMIADVCGQQVLGMMGELVDHALVQQPRPGRYRLLEPIRHLVFAGAADGAEAPAMADVVTRYLNRYHRMAAAGDIAALSAELPELISALDSALTLGVHRRRKATRRLWSTRQKWDESGSGVIEAMREALGEQLAASDWWQETLAFFEPFRDPALFASAERAAVQLQIGRTERAVRHNNRLIAQFNGLAYLDTGRLADARDNLARAADLLREQEAPLGDVGRDWELSHVLAELSALTAAPQAADSAREAVRLVVRLVRLEPGAADYVLPRAAVTLAWWGHHGEAREILGQWQAQAGDDSTRHLHRTMLVSLLHGDFARVRKLNAASGIPAPRPAVQIMLCRSWAEILDGDPGRAVPDLDRAAAICGQLNWGLPQPEISRARAHAALRTDDVTSALDCVRDGLARAAALPEPMAAFRLVHTAAAAARAARLPSAQAVASLARTVRGACAAPPWPFTAREYESWDAEAAAPQIEGAPDELILRTTDRVRSALLAGD